jgi:hypothetical protein
MLVDIELYAFRVAEPVRTAISCRYASTGVRTKIGIFLVVFFWYSA